MTLLCSARTHTHTHTHTHTSTHKVLEFMIVHKLARTRLLGHFCCLTADAAVHTSTLACAHTRPQTCTHTRTYTHEPNTHARTHTHIHTRCRSFGLGRPALGPGCGMRGSCLRPTVRAVTRHCGSWGLLL